LNSDGTLFAHPNREYVMDQTNVFTDSGSLADAGTAIQELGVGNAGVIRYNLDGARRWMALTPVESTGWTIGVGALEADVLRDVHALRNFFGFASVAFLAVGVLGAVAVGRQVSVPLSRVQTVIEAAAAGDLTRMAQVRSKDEIGTVAQAVNTTMESMREMLGLITQSTAELANTSSRLAAASQQVSASVEEVASTTNEFSGTLDSLNTNAQQMKETVQGVAREADEGTKAIADIVRQMQLLRDSTHSLASDVSSLGGLSEQIGNIVHTIGAIADQTNLLALNAAIEAARAGEHGRGFAVVAEEVRKLAEESATAAKSIEQLIGRIQSGIGGIVSAMDAGTQQTETALQNVHHSSQILGEILHSVEEIQRQVAGFTAGLEQINLGGHEIASASQEQAASMQEIASSAQELMAMGARLQELVERFKLKAE
ncbi:MAG: methyl-accepting chemotaxis protein, partial [Firmicutes bacterium]|nr:methyl-accepting chemotaxis protein [Bacillota bacterium]